MGKPTALTPKPENVPGELKELSQWVLWRYLPPDPGKDRWRKVPFQTNGNKARSNDAATWTTFTNVWSTFERGGFDGIGFVFAENDPYIAVDLDHAYDPQADRFTDDAISILSRLGSYAELSASGTGVHALLKGNYPFDRGRKAGNIEMYKTKRFFTITGYALDALPAEPQERQEVIDYLASIYFSPPENRQQVSACVITMDDAQIVERAMRARNGGKFRDLYHNGHYQSYGYPSQSEAEAGLLGILGFYTRDSAQLDRLMRASALRREKWDSRRGDSTYGKKTITNILAKGGETYTGDTVPMAPIAGKNGHDKQDAHTNTAPIDLDPDSEDESEIVPAPRYILHWLREAFGPDEPTYWVVDNLFQRGSVNLLFGAPGTKKTYALLDCAMCILLGLPWLQRPTEQGTVLLIDEESGPKRLKKRLKEVSRAHRVPYDAPLAYTTLEMFNLLHSPADVQHLDAIIGVVQPALVIVDALADVMPGGDENTVQDTHPVFQRLKHLAHKHNCAIVVIHHSNKTGKYRGSSAIPGVVDVMLSIDSPNGSNDITFTTEKNRDGEMQTFSAQILFDTMMGTVRLISAETPSKPAHERASIRHVLEYLQTNGGGAWVEDITASPTICSPMAARKAIYDLAAQGRVIRTDTGEQGKKAYYELTANGL